QRDGARQCGTLPARQAGDEIGQGGSVEACHGRYSCRRFATAVGGIAHRPSRRGEVASLCHRLPHLRPQSDAKRDRSRNSGNRSPFMQPFFSRRSLLRLALAQAGAVTLAGCSSAIGALDSSSTPAATGNSSPTGARGGPVVYAVTTRAPVNGASERPWFGSARSGVTRAVAVRFDPPPEGFFDRIGATLTGDWHINAVEP